MYAGHHTLDDALVDLFTRGRDGGESLSEILYQAFRFETYQDSETFKTALLRASEGFLLDPKQTSSSGPVQPGVPPTRFSAQGQVPFSHLQPGQQFSSVAGPVVGIPLSAFQTQRAPSQFSAPGQSSSPVFTRPSSPGASVQVSSLSRRSSSPVTQQTAASSAWIAPGGYVADLNAPSVYAPSRLALPSPGTLRTHQALGADFGLGTVARQPTVVQPSALWSPVTSPYASPTGSPLLARSPSPRGSIQVDSLSPRSIRK